MLSVQLAFKKYKTSTFEILTPFLAETVTRYTDAVTESDSTSFAIAFSYNVHSDFLRLKMTA